MVVPFNIIEFQHDFFLVGPSYKPGKIDECSKEGKRDGIRMHMDARWTVDTRARDEEGGWELAPPTVIIPMLSNRLCCRCRNNRTSSTAQTQSNESRKIVEPADPADTEEHEAEAERQNTTGVGAGGVRMRGWQHQPSTIDEKKSLVPVLYDWLANHNLLWPSLSCWSASHLSLSRTSPSRGFLGSVEALLGF
ncbi:hypothetical protein Ancab_017984 [Ancistrocladus abbreviatus]